MTLGTALFLASNTALQAAEKPKGATQQKRVTTQSTLSAKESTIAAGNPREVVVRAPLIRFLSFKSNILSVFSAKPEIVDARALNARTLSVNGVGTGSSTLAVFVERFRGDKKGQVQIFNIKVEPATLSIISKTPEISADDSRFEEIDRKKILQALGHLEPENAGVLEDLIIAEIKKRDERIRELETQLAAKNQ
jgi:hypothetical protein